MLPLVEGTSKSKPVFRERTLMDFRGETAEEGEHDDP